MITRLLIKNFQSHRKLDLKLGGGVTTIVGSTDAGKSAVIRALRFLMLNKPSGTAFITDGEDTVEVRIKIDGSTIKRIKGKTSSYHRNSDEYLAFGTIVPEPIEEICNVDDVNFQNQHDPPFWLSLSAGQVSSELNKIINLSIIDESLGRVGQVVRSAKTQLIDAQGRLTNAENAVTALAWVPAMKQRLIALTRQERACETISRYVARTASLTEDIKSCVRGRNIAAGVASAGMNAVTAGRNVLNLIEEIGEIEDLLMNIKDVRGLIQHKLPSFSRLERLHTELQDDSLTRLTAILSGIDFLQEQLCDSKDQLEETEQTLERELKGKCPLCKSPMKL